jgi:hypothetical protein
VARDTDTLVMTKGERAALQAVAGSTWQSVRVTDAATLVRKGLVRNRFPLELTQLGEQILQILG